MIKKSCIALPVVCLLVFLGRAQEQPASEIAALPIGRGVYYHAPSGWTAIPFTILIPSINAGGWTLWPSKTVAEIKNPFPEVRISTLRPTLYLRGISPAVGIYLVREIAVHDFRKVRLSLRRDEQEWTHFEDTVPFDREQLDGGVTRIRPRGDLPPATYALATGFDKRSRSIFLAFEFEITADSKP